MRCPEDRNLASKVPEIDFILGGHDHSFFSEVDNDTGAFLIKSGTDFDEFSDCDILLNANVDVFE